jgi:hypothetical protein
LKEAIGQRSYFAAMVAVTPLPVAMSRTRSEDRTRRLISKVVDVPDNHRLSKSADGLFALCSASESSPVMVVLTALGQLGHVLSGFCNRQLVELVNALLDILYRWGCGKTSASALRTSGVDLEAPPRVESHLKVFRNQSSLTGRTRRRARHRLPALSSPDLTSLLGPVRIGDAWSERRDLNPRPLGPQPRTRSCRIWREFSTNCTCSVEAP